MEAGRKCSHVYPPVCNSPNRLLTCDSVNPQLYLAASGAFLINNGAVSIQEVNIVQTK